MWEINLAMHRVLKMLELSKRETRLPRREGDERHLSLVIGWKVEKLLRVLVHVLRGLEVVLKSDSVRMREVLGGVWR